MIWTAGHSNQPGPALIELLAAAGIELLVDVRRYPASRRNPQFNREALAATLADDGIAYRHGEALGGRREPLPDSPNQGLRDAGFRGFADYMQTPEFDAALAELMAESEQRRLAIMCAEALPWRCHRSLISDALMARSREVTHLLPGGKTKPHQLTTAARVTDQRVTYPALL